MLELRARLRKWEDRDIDKAIRKLKPTRGEMSYLVRKGFRMVLAEMETIDDIETAIERSCYGESS